MGIPQRLLQRGISEETAEKYGVRDYVSHGINPADQWIEIPYYKNGVKVNSKIRMLNNDNGQKQMRFALAQSKGGEVCVYNHDCLLDDSLKDQPVVITEGEMDTLAALESGIRRAISVPTGAPKKPSEKPSKTKYAPIIEIIPLLKGCNQIILATDDDESGEALAIDLMTILGKGRCKRITYPEGCNDLNDVLIKQGRSAVQEIITESEFVRFPAMYSLSQLPILPPLEYKALEWNLDEYMKIYKPQLTIITGIPSHGKSTFINELACRLVALHKWKILFASFEQNPYRVHRINLATWFHAKPFDQQSKTEQDTAHRWIEENFTFIMPDIQDDPTLDWMIEYISAAISQRSIDMVVIDPWSRLSHTTDEGETVTEYIREALRTLNSFIAEKEVSLIIAAHPKKMVANSKGTYPVPNLYDISDSQHWYNQCELGLVVYRDFEYDETQIYVSKVKDEGESGKQGMCKLSFDTQSKRYSDL